jgi:hypothetical protein
MGYRRKNYRLDWPADHEYGGADPLAVVMRGMNHGELEEISLLRAGVDENSSLAMLGPILDILEKGIRSWNYEDEDGVPVPLSEMRQQDVRLLLAILTAWTQIVGEIPAPLSKPSSDGKKSEEGSIPMEIPSESHPSSNTPNSF